jgi:hypothetical protein
LLPVLLLTLPYNQTLGAAVCLHAAGDGAAVAAAAFVLHSQAALKVQIWAHHQALPLVLLPNPLQSECLHYCVRCLLQPMLELLSLLPLSLLLRITTKDKAMPAAPHGTHHPPAAKLLLLLQLLLPTLSAHHCKTN